MHLQKYFTLNFLSMKFFLSKKFRTTVYSYLYIYHSYLHMHMLVCIYVHVNIYTYIPDSVDVIRFTWGELDEESSMNKDTLATKYANNSNHALCI